MGHTLLFIYFKIILLQYFQLYPNGFYDSKLSNEVNTFFK